MTYITNNTTGIASLDGAIFTDSNSLNIGTPKNPLEIRGNVVRIGELEMTFEELELCFRHLKKLTKEEHPEEFI